jgi:hypothetical protein
MSAMWVTRQNQAATKVAERACLPLWAALEAIDWRVAKRTAEIEAA